MAPPPNNNLAASKLSTLNPTPAITRSITPDSILREKDSQVSIIFGNITDATDATNAQIRDYQCQVKATLTNILNDERVKHDPSGSRYVQERLLENEQDMRKQRRHSLETCTAKRTMLF
ncbi:hypothetical protein DTO013E5_8802 [Penicillium roqueforti]|uniref:Genomic scaffold, ProqFM164S01 n=1 Tax=Penicillium roqueforti (strain FM164) TaxID=1365484 RepID=W6PU99_PENRF|nr:uncharacterized protein LCP9604111_7079 [Penicillium roqueforti]CDM27763.1 unnamed protein product [Penicillium roqueforti FM164]KAF9244687.1 hypothetical protein LCP9604111_7079 [Penicillium roqueforti]KAI1831293.1 hypothetical protein CBS147337_8051 [Penicillium roqueforti]KAI2681037.1 hypothetical protein LCP963914a_6988 [Penicillium roqueforti]KAI2689595.1 hypothetical protein CBS147355_46 [Penicillium roqueforti]